MRRSPPTPSSSRVQAIKSHDFAFHAFQEPIVSGEQKLAIDPVLFAARAAALPALGSGGAGETVTGPFEFRDSDAPSPELARTPFFNRASRPRRDRSSEGDYSRRVCGWLKLCLKAQK